MIKTIGNIRTMQSTRMNIYDYQNEAEDWEEKYMMELGKRQLLQDVVKKQKEEIKKQKEEIKQWRNKAEDMCGIMMTAMDLQDRHQTLLQTCKELCASFGYWDSDSDDDK